MNTVFRINFLTIPSISHYLLESEIGKQGRYLMYLPLNKAQYVSINGFELKNFASYYSTMSIIVESGV